jgi:O-antigen/teichoic acid export membrane protein
MGRSARFLANVIWSWTGVGISLVAGLLLSPYLIRKLGPDGYGVWALSFALVEYYFMMDLGFRSATVKYVAHYTALGEPEKVREVVNTSVSYAFFAGALIFTIVALFAGRLERLFQIAPHYHGTFSTLVMLITASWAIGVVFSLFGASLEAVQRFDLSNRVLIAATTIRTLGTFALLYLGYGLLAIGVMVIVTQLVTYALQFLFYRRVFERPEISPRYARWATLVMMGRFGLHTFLVNVSNQLLTQTAPLLIGHFRPAAFVGYYSLPQRLLQSPVDLVCRIGLVTNSNAAELVARRETTALRKLAIYPNRYSLMLFMPLAIFLWVYGDALLRVWVRPDFAARSAPVLPILLAGSVIALVGQFSSSMLLQGLGRHQNYARGMVVEAIFGTALLFWVVPRYGIVGAAWVAASSMVLNRGLLTAWLTSQTVEIGYVRYVTSVYGPPLLAGIAPAALAWLLHRGTLPGDTWTQLASAGLMIGAVYYAIGFFTCLRPEHRALAWQALDRGRARFTQTVPASASAAR